LGFWPAIVEEVKLRVERLLRVLIESGQEGYCREETKKGFHRRAALVQTDDDLELLPAANRMKQPAHTFFASPGDGKSCSTAVVPGGRGPDGINNRLVRTEDDPQESSLPMLTRSGARECYYFSGDQQSWTLSGAAFSPQLWLAGFSAVRAGRHDRDLRPLELPKLNLLGSLE